MENWKDIKGYEGRYQVSDMGRVKSLSRKWRGNDKILKPLYMRAGYYGVDLYKHGKKTRKMIQIHRLVLSAFCGESNMECNHIDRNPANNKLDNLEYCTRTGNVPRGEFHGMTNLTKEDIITIRRLSDEMFYKDIAKKYGICKSSVFNIVKRKTWGHI